MRFFVVLALLVPSAAFAGDWCMDNAQQTDMTKALAKVAKGTRDTETIGTANNFWCIIHGPAKGEKEPTDTEQAKRVAAITDACTKIVPAHDKKKDDRAEVEEALKYLTDECTRHLVENGVPKLGDHDLFADATDGKFTWHQPAPYAIAAGSGDARARLFVLDQFRAAIIVVKKRKVSPGWQTEAWKNHRLGALAALEKVATAEDLPFLDEIIASTPAKEKKILAAAKQAREAAQLRPVGLSAAQ